MRGSNVNGDIAEIERPELPEFRLWYCVLMRVLEDVLLPRRCEERDGARAWLNAAGPD